MAASGPPKEIITQEMKLPLSEVLKRELSNNLGATRVTALLSNGFFVFSTSSKQVRLLNFFENTAENVDLVLPKFEVIRKIIPVSAFFYGVVTSADKLLIFDPRNPRKTLYKLNIHEFEDATFKLRPQNNNYLLIHSVDEDVKLVDLSQGKSKTVAKHALAATFAPNGDIMIATEENWQFRVLVLGIDYKTGRDFLKKIYIIRNVLQITDVHFSPSNPNQLIVNSLTSNSALFQIVEDKLKRIYPPKGLFVDLFFLPDGSVRELQDAADNFWDRFIIENDQLIFSGRCQLNPWGLRFSPDGYMIQRGGAIFDTFKIPTQRNYCEDKQALVIQTTKLPSPLAQMIVEYAATPEELVNPSMAFTVLVRDGVDLVVAARFAELYRQLELDISKMGKEKGFFEKNTQRPLKLLKEEKDTLEQLVKLLNDHGRETMKSFDQCIELAFNQFPAPMTRLLTKYETIKKSDAKKNLNPTSN